MTKAVARISYIKPGDFETVCRFLPDQGADRVLNVGPYEKAVFLQGGIITDQFSEGSKPIPEDAKVAIASLRKFQMVYCFGDHEKSTYNTPHVLAPSFQVNGGEEIRSMTVAVDFALDRNDRTNIERLLAVQPAEAGVITVRDIARTVGMTATIQSLIAAQTAMNGDSIKLDTQHQEILKNAVTGTAQAFLNRYGIIVELATLAVYATSRDAEMKQGEYDRETRERIRRDRTELNASREREKVLLQKLKNATIEGDTERARTEVLEERKKQAELEAELATYAQQANETSPAVRRDNRPQGKDKKLQSEKPKKEELSLAEIQGELKRRKKEKEKREQRFEEMNSALIQAVNEGDADTVIYLIDLGADINAKNKYGWTPLHLAASAWEDKPETAVASHRQGRGCER